MLLHSMAKPVQITVAQKFEQKKQHLHLLRQSIERLYDFQKSGVPYTWILDFTGDICFKITHKITLTYLVSYSGKYTQHIMKWSAMGCSSLANHQHVCPGDPRDFGSKPTSC